MTIRLLPGRQLRWSPAWDCATDRVAFDVTSGDYWVLTAEAQALLEWLAVEPRTADAVWQRLPPAPEDGHALLFGLVEAGLVTGWRDGRPVPMPLPTAAADTAG